MTLDRKKENYKCIPSLKLMEGFNPASFWRIYLKLEPSATALLSLQAGKAAHLPGRVKPGDLGQRGCSSTELSTLSSSSSLQEKWRKESNSRQTTSKVTSYAKKPAKICSPMIFLPGSTIIYTKMPSPYRRVPDL